MRAVPADSFEGFGSDSFLDVVTNVVGILIILVVVVGLRVKNAHLAAPAEPSDAGRALEGAQVTALALERDVMALAERIRALRLFGARRFRERAVLATQAAAFEHADRERRRELDTHARGDAELRDQLAAAQESLQRLERELDERKVDAARRTIEIETFPTPLSRTVDGKEAHFQLRAGRVVYIPLDVLLEQFKNDARSHLWKLRDVPEVTATVGPVDDFRLRYTLERIDIALDSQLASGRAGSYARLVKWTLIPSRGQLGEALSEALAPDSDFRRALATLKARETTVTLWTYEDSFAEFRALRKELFGLDFAIAGRPLPEGMPIGGSPDGSKSAAQ